MIDTLRVLTHRIYGTSPEKWLYWDVNQRTKFHVIDRKNGNRIGIFTAEPFLVFHHVNAFEAGGKIYLDACCYHDDTILRQTHLTNLRAPVRPGQKKFDLPEVRRYELPLDELKGEDDQVPLVKGGDGYDYSLLFVGMDLPRINYADYNGKPYRYVELSCYVQNILHDSTGQTKETASCFFVLSDSVKSEF